MDSHLLALRDSKASAWLKPSPVGAKTCRAASARLFESVVKYLPKESLRTLLTEEFDGDQIWQQIELKHRPLLACVRRNTRPLEKLQEDDDVFGLGETEAEEDAQPSLPGDSQNGHFGDEESDVEQEEMDMEDEDEDEDEDNSDGESEEDDTLKPVEDAFLKLSDMERFLEDAEARQQQGGNAEDDEDEMDDDMSSGEMEPIRYADFFGRKKNTKPAKPKAARLDEVEYEEGFGADEDEDEMEVGAADEEDEDEDEDEDEIDGADEEDEDEAEKKEEVHISKGTETKSTHEKQVEKIQKRIEQLEKANLDPKDWTMRGEITAGKRPKNSALEVELDFDHNIRPVPVITEEVTASIEDLIRRRIIEGRFDDVVRKQKLPEAPPAEKMEIDEAKSKKGLGELYEAEYMVSAGLASAATTESQTLRTQAAAVFKTLCLKLDALSHFHFAPKPVIEEMAIKPHVPALAMEEVAPVFASEASMLAPEEIFEGKEAIKDEKELTPGERKQRRATKKRKHSAYQKQQEQQKKPRLDEKVTDKMAIQPKKGTSEFAKSSKVFAKLDLEKEEPLKKASSKVEKSVKAPSLKL